MGVVNYTDDDLRKFKAQVVLDLWVNKGLSTPVPSLRPRTKLPVEVSRSLQRGETTTKPLVDLNFKVPAEFR